MNLNESLAAELQYEAATTRRMLERVPEAALAWRPHEKSRTLGETAAHIAHLPGIFITPIDRDGFDRNDYQPALETSTVEGILQTFDQNISDGLEALKTQTGERMLGAWRYTYGERVIFELPRVAVVRAMALNHLIHHRGQLSVYLRLLDVPLPSVYGPTADEPLL
jgi:uncharacterized damage-inducible protein DinB